MDIRNLAPIPDDICPITDDRAVDVVYTLEELEQFARKYEGILDMSTGILRVTNDEYGYFSTDDQ